MCYLCAFSHVQPVAAMLLDHWRRDGQIWSIQCSWRLTYWRSLNWGTSSWFGWIWPSLPFALQPISTLLVLETHNIHIGKRIRGKSTKRNCSQKALETEADRVHSMTINSVQTSLFLQSTRKLSILECLNNIVWSKPSVYFGLNYS